MSWLAGLLPDARAAVDWLLRLGVLGAIFAWGRGAFSGWRRRRAERRGLLRLLGIEVGRNARVVEGWTIEEFREAGSRTGPLRTDAWEQTRVALTQVLGEREFSRLVDYYEDARRMNELWSPESSPRMRVEEGEQVRKRLRGSGRSIAEMIERDSG